MGETCGDRSIEHVLQLMEREDVAPERFKITHRVPWGVWHLLSPNVAHVYGMPLNTFRHTLRRLPWLLA